MMVSFLPKGWDDYLYWQETDAEILKKINTLIRDIGEILSMALESRSHCGTILVALGPVGLQGSID